MSDTLEFVRGPLFIATFTFMVLGLSRHVLLRTVAIRRALKRTPHRNVPWGSVIRKTVTWMVPVKHVMRGAPLLSITSVLFHVCILIVPLFLAQHIFLWHRSIGLSWPALSRTLADILTQIALAMGVILLVFRMFNRTARNMSRRSDYLLLIAVTLPFASGFFALHPSLSPFPYATMILIHVLSAELTFVLLPSTKLAHVVLFVFDRASTDIFWRFVPGAGDRVAEELRGSPKGAEA